jgi:hypothetical protein
MRLQLADPAVSSDIRNAVVVLSAGAQNPMEQARETWKTHMIYK